MPGRVNAIKWLGVLQLIFGLLIFIVSIALFAITFEATAVRASTSKASTATFMPWTINGFILAFLALGAGTAGASMSRYEGLIHNVSLKNITLALSVMNAFAAIMYMVLLGTVYFYMVDNNAIGNFDASFKAAFSMVVVIIILAFFDMIVAFMSVILCALWMPREGNSSSYQSGGYSNERVVEEPYVVREERIPYARSHTGVYGKSYPSYDYYGGGYRTLPALKY